MPIKIVRRGKKGIFQAIGTVRGVRVFESTGTTSREHAEAIAIQIEKRILDETVFGKRATATFAEAVEAYLDGGGSPRFLAPLNEHFGRWKMADITQEEVMKFAKKHYPTAAPQTINRQVFTPLIAVWEVANTAKLCPPHEFRRPKPPDREVVTFADDDFISRLLPACNERLKAAVLFITFSGARASECCRLSDETGDIDWKKKTAILRRTKSGKPRVVVLPETVYKALLLLKDRKGPLFGYSSRFSLNQALKRACRRAGLPVMTSHKIGRHAFAARHLRNGRTLKELQEAGEWSAKSLPMIGEIYGHLEQSQIDQMVREADKGLAEMMRQQARRKLRVVKGKKRA